MTDAVQESFAGGVVLVGSGGILGRAWLALLKQLDISHSAYNRRDLDITCQGALDATIPPGTRVVINAAAYTDVDGAEGEEEEAYQVNCTAVGHLGRRCQSIGCTLIHYSTDYVFAGTATEPYQVDAPLRPVNAYGRTKAAGEQVLRETGCDHLLIRTSWLYAPWGSNFVLRMLQLMQQCDSLRVVDDQRGRPASAVHLAQVSLDLYRTGARDAWHVTDAGDCTWYEFAIEILQQTQQTCRIEPCPSAEFPRPATRPHYSVLDLSHTEKFLEPLAFWKTNLAEVLRQI